MVRFTQALIFLTLFVVGMFTPAFAGSGVIVLDQTISTAAVTTYTLSAPATGKVQDIYIKTPGADIATVVTIYNSATGQNVYTTSVATTSLVQDVSAEITGVNTWIAPGMAIKVQFDKAPQATNTSLKLIVFYNDGG